VVSNSATLKLAKFKFEKFNTGKAPMREEVK